MKVASATIEQPFVSKEFSVKENAGLCAQLADGEIKSIGFYDHSMSIMLSQAFTLAQAKALVAELQDFIADIEKEYGKGKA